MTTLADLIRPASEQTKNKGTTTTIFGDAGVGKTTIAARCFPKPLVMPIENGLLSIPDVPALQQPTESGNVTWYLNTIRDEVDAGTFQFKTIVLDSVSELDTMISRELCVEDGVNNISDYQKGFGKGQAAMANRQREVREACKELTDRGIHIVAIAHAEVKQMDPPDGESYSRFVMQLVKGSAAQWTNQVDSVIHVKESVTLAQQKGSDRKIAKAVKNQRLLDMVAKPAGVSKNRFGVSKEVTFTYNPEDGVFNNPLSPIYGFEQTTGA